MLAISRGNCARHGDDTLSTIQFLRLQCKWRSLPLLLCSPQLSQSPFRRQFTIIVLYRQIKTQPATNLIGTGRRPTLYGLALPRCCPAPTSLYTQISQGSEEGSLKIALRRVGIMIYALIAPELVVVWATRQRVIAHRLRRGESARALDLARALNTYSQN